MNADSQFVFDLRSSAFTPNAPHTFEQTIEYRKAGSGFIGG